MTNKPMLSVERELLERAASAIEKHHGSLQWVIASDLRALLDKPVLESQYEGMTQDQAPVTVVIPERQIVPDNLMAGLTRKWCEGWNDALEEVARLNGVKP